VGVVSICTDPAPLPPAPSAATPSAAPLPAAAAAAAGATTLAAVSEEGGRQRTAEEGGRQRTLVRDGLGMTAKDLLQQKVQPGPARPDPTRPQTAWAAWRGRALWSWRGTRVMDFGVGRGDERLHPQGTCGYTPRGRAVTPPGDVAQESGREGERDRREVSKGAVSPLGTCGDAFGGRAHVRTLVEWGAGRGEGAGTRANTETRGRPQPVCVL
jgi:hypothetical protein